jgi:hypothetical protein
VLVTRPSQGLGSKARKRWIGLGQSRIFASFQNWLLGVSLSKDFPGWLLSWRDGFQGDAALHLAKDHGAFLRADNTKPTRRG